MTKDEPLDEGRLKQDIAQEFADSGMPPRQALVLGKWLATQSLACDVHNGWMSAWSLRPPPVHDEALERAVNRLDEEIAAVRGRLVSTTPTGISMQTARELAVQLSGVERAVRTLKSLAAEGSRTSEQIAHARRHLQRADAALSACSVRSTNPKEIP